MLSFLRNISLFLLTNLSRTQAATPSPSSPTLIHQFPRGAWAENIAIRHNGNLLVILHDRPELHEINPFTDPPTDRLVARFANFSGLLGIAETGVGSDVFAVMPFRGSEFAVWTVNLAIAGGEGDGEGEGAKREVIHRVEGAGMLNGMTRLRDGVLLASDTKRGSAVRFDISTRTYEVAIEDPTMDGGVPFLGMGINGLRVHDDHLYYTNSFKGLVCRVPIHPIHGTTLGPVQLLGKGLKMLDDLAIDDEGTAYVMQWIDGSVVRLPLEGDVQTIATGLDHPTSAQFGRTERDRRVLYVSASGNPLKLALKGFFEGGKVYAVPLK